MYGEPFDNDPASSALPWGNPRSAALPRIMQGHTLARSLAFFFVFKGQACIDLVRHDTALASGTVSQIVTPYGNTWQMGVGASTVGGFLTRGGDTGYYNRTPSALSIACGAWNQAAITKPAVNGRNVFAYWADDSSGANELEVGLENGSSLMHGYCQVSGSSSAATATVSAPTPDGNATKVAATVAGSYTGGAVRVAYQSQSPSGNQAAQAGVVSTTKTVVNLSQIFIGDQFASAATGRALLWVAGWFRALSAADLAIAVNGAGLPPKGLLTPGHGVFIGAAAA